MSFENIENRKPAIEIAGDGSIWRVQSQELRSAVKMARDAHDTIVPPDEDSLQLVECQFCDRRFKPDRLVVHNRSCTAFNCARRICEHINRKVLEVVGKPMHLHSVSPKVQLVSSHPIEFSTYNLNLEHYPHAFEKLDPESLSKCECCARTFLPDRLVVHGRSCTTEHPARSVGDCRIGDSYADRVALIRFGYGLDPVGGSSCRSSSVTNWRAASAALREAVRAAKQKEAEESPSVVECPHCLKKFREKAGARHIQMCDRQWANLNGKGAPDAKWRGQSLHFRLQLREAKESHLASVAIDHWKEAMVLEG